MRVRFRAAALILPIVLSIAASPYAFAMQVGNGWAVADTEPKATSAQHDLPKPLHSRGELENYLRAAAAKNRSTPFDRLSPGARIRVLGSIEFNDRGNADVPFTDDLSELDGTEIRELLALFGQQELADYYSPADQSDPLTSDFQTTAEQLSDLERRYNRFYFNTLNPPGRDESARAVQMQMQLAKQLPEIDNAQSISALDDHDLRLLFRATESASSFATNPRMVDTLARLLRTMEARGIASGSNIRLAYQQLLTIRHFVQARRFASAHPDVELASLPVLHDRIPASNTQPTTWVVAADSKSMTRTPVDLGPLQILVMAGCHYSEDAARAISADPVLGPVFRDHARWLMQPPGQEKIADVSEWNRKYPDAQAELVYDRSDWPMLPHWVMPTYVIVKGGKVLDSANGWPPNPDRQHLLDMLAHAGLLPAGKQ